MTRRFWTAALAACGLLTGGLAHAGLLDSPPPTFEGGAPGKIVYRMGPIHHEPGWVDTVVTCTNLAEGPTSLAIEFFDDEDARALIARSVAPAGGGVTFATSVDAGGEQAVVLSELPPLQHGKARVSATSARLSCAARFHIRSADGSTKEAPLELLKKVALGD